MESVRVCGLNIFLNDNHDIPAILEVMVINVYQVHKLSRGQVVLDLGAGIGEYSMIASEKVGPDGLVIAVEPSPLDFEFLCKNLSVNSCKNVIPLNKAISDKEGEISIEFKGQQFSAQALTTSEIGDILRERGKDSIDIMKLDIEGKEVDALHLLSKFLEGILFFPIELHGTKRMVDSILNPSGFKFKRITRKSYLLAGLKFLLVHPLTTWNLWKIFRGGGENPGIRKILSGIEIQANEELMVGMYFKPEN